MMEGITRDFQETILEPVQQQAATSMRGQSTIAYQPSYPDETTIETLVAEVCRDNNLTDEASAWLTALRSLGAKKVSDLRELEDRDWDAVGFTIVAKRLLKKAILSTKPVSKKREE